MKESTLFQMRVETSAYLSNCMKKINVGGTEIHGQSSSLFAQGNQATRIII